MSSSSSSSREVREARNWDNIRQPAAEQARKIATDRLPTESGGVQSVEWIGRVADWVAARALGSEIRCK